jgi:L-asparaginase/Glu-tRNA(Gln) amidotransferase subunit D
MRIAVVSTGGTILSDESGSGLASRYRGRQLVMGLESRGYSLPKDVELSFFDLMACDSSQMWTDELNQISTSVYGLVNEGGYDGVVLFCGTDTGARAGKHLTYAMLTRKPIILTGSQKKFADADSDAPPNIFSTIMFARHFISEDEGGLFPSVFNSYDGQIFFTENLGEGIEHSLRDEMMEIYHTERVYRADQIVREHPVKLNRIFISSARPPYATVDTEGRVSILNLARWSARSHLFVPGVDERGYYDTDERTCFTLIGNRFLSECYERTDLFTGFEYDNILVIPPFQSPKQVRKSGMKGVIFQSPGEGNARISDGWGDHLSYWLNHEVPVIVTTSSGAAVSMRYEVGRRMYTEYGVIPAGDLLGEDAFVRLAYLLGHARTIRQIARNHNIPYLALMRQLFCGGTIYGCEKDQRLIEKTTPTCTHNDMIRTWPIPDTAEFLAGYVKNRIQQLSDQGIPIPYCR